jgi:type I restriction enzyme S subunit
MKMSTIKLGEFVTIRKGRKAPELYDTQINGARRYLQIPDLRGEGKPRFAIDPKGVLSNEKDVIIVWDGANAGTVSFDLAGYIGSTLTILRLKNDNVDTTYLGRYLQSRFSYLNELTTGATIPHIDRARLEALLIPLPPLPVQRRIAAILDKADAIRRRRQEAMQVTEKILGSVFLEMFGDLETNPKGWPIHLLGDHLAFVTSGSRGWAKYYSSSGARFIRSLDVQMNRISDTGAVFVSPPPGPETKRTQVHPGDVLLTITGSRIGRVAAFSQDIGNAYVSQHVAIIRLDGVLRPRFLSMFLSDKRGGQHQIQQLHYGQTKPGLNLEQIRKFKVPYPPLSLQDRFIAIWEHYDRNLDHLSMACRGSEDLFNSLVQSAFQGEL